MWIFPFERYSIVTNSSSDVVIKQIGENINPPIKFSFKNIFKKPDSDKYFNGSYNEKRFSLIQAMKQGRNSFRPVIKCKVVKYDNGSKVTIIMYLHPICFLFLLWILILSLGLNKMDFSQYVFKPDPNGFIFLFVIYCIFTGMFKYEVIKDKDILDRIIN